MSGVGVLFSESEADFVGVTGFSFSTALTDMVEETALTMADLGGGWSGDAGEGRMAFLTT